jgi:hypothetical protein
MTVRVTNKKKDLNSKYRMSVQVSLTGLSFLLEEENAVFFSKTINFRETRNPEEILLEIETAFEQNPALNQPVFDLVLIHQNPLYTFVPFYLFKEGEAASYLKLNSRVFKTDFVAFDSLENHELVNVYVPLANVNNYFFEKYGEYSFYHFTTIFIEEVLKKEKTGNHAKMYAHLHGHQV